MSAEVKTWKCGSLTYTKRGLIVLFGWLLWGDFCFTFMEAVVPSILPLHLRNLGASNTLIGIVLTTLPGIFNVTITPWVSFNPDLRHDLPVCLFGSVTMCILFQSRIISRFSPSRWVLISSSSLLIYAL